MTGMFHDAKDIVQNVPDGNSRVYIRTSAGRDKIALMKLDLSTSKQEVIFERPDVDVSAFRIDFPAYTPLRVLYHHDLPGYHYFDPKLQEDLEKLLGAGPMLHNISSASADHMHLTIRPETDRSGASTYLIDRRSGNKELLAAHPLNKYEEFLSETRPIRFKAQDGLPISGYSDYTPRYGRGSTCPWFSRSMAALGGKTRGVSIEIRNFWPTGAMPFSK